PKGKIYSFTSKRNFYYLIQRGKEKGRLDQTFYELAKNYGAKVIFNSKLAENKMKINATGPKVTSAMAFGFTFETDAKQRNFILLDNDFAPKGYAYLLTRNGFGTVATAFYGDYRQGKFYLEKCFERFSQISPFESGETKYFACRGSYFPTETLVSDNGILTIGEAGGLQDYLLGFGLRYAILSGFYAAQSILTGENFDELWKKEFEQPLKASLLNRYAFEKMSNDDFEKLLPKVVKEGSLHNFLTRVYNFGLATDFAFPIVKWVFRERFPKFV
ncbi:hypothetical protein IT568_05505, partial [bacterium]|nr:hypothetical protein [bacterium]